MVVGAGSVAADGSPPCYVTALNSSANPVCPPSPASVYAAAGIPYIQPGYVYTGTPYYPVPYTYTGVPVAPPIYPYPAVPYYPPTGAVYGYTAAGPIVGFDANGSALVYDVAGGTTDPYTIGPNGKWCEANSLGQCE
jgi:hypothetical protein